MISKKSLEKIANISKIPLQTLLDALAKEEEIDVEVPENLHVFTEDEITQRDNNNKTSGKKEAEAVGEEKGKELATKAIKNKLGITDASKDPDTVASLIQTMIAGDNSLKEQVTLLQSDLAKKDGEINTLKLTVDGIKTDSELLSILPANKSTALETAEHLDLIKKNLEFTDEGVKYKGEVIRDAQTKNALDRKEAIEFFYTQRPGLLAEGNGTGNGAAGGRGGGNSSGSAGKFATLKEVRVAWQAQNSGQNWGNVSSQDHLTKILKDNPDIIMEDDGN